MVGAEAKEREKERERDRATERQRRSSAGKPAEPAEKDARGKLGCRKAGEIFMYPHNSNPSNPLGGCIQDAGSKLHAEGPKF